MTDRNGVVPQLLGAAVGIVLGSALLFAVVGMLRDDGPVEPEVAAEPSPSETLAAAEDDESAPSPSPEAPADDAASEDEASATPEPTPEATAEPSPEASEQPASTEEVDPGSVSIQVLDAVGGDGGSTAARAVAEELRDAGFDVVVVNRAGRSYEETTVFWSSGQAAGGQQVAAAIGAARAEETPAEVQLSNSVDVHVVVGADRT